MDRDVELAVLDDFFDQHANRSTTLADEPYRNPAASYTDPGRLEAEVDTLLRGRPALVALSPDLPATGEYLTREVAGVPILLVRGEDAVVRAYLNACRHRGGRVADGSGRAGRAFVCPYHAWTYDHDGRLLGQPQARGCFAGPGTPGSDLIPLAVAERFGLVFVRITGDEPIDIAAELTGLAGELASHDFEGYSFAEEHSGEWATNWKLAMDTFLEGYHIFALHRHTLSPDFLSAPSHTQLFGDHGRMTVFRRSTVGLKEVDREEWRLRPHTTIVYRIFPNVVLNLPSSGHAELWRIEPLDDDPGRCRVIVRFYLPAVPQTDKARSFWRKNIDLTVSVVFDEDFKQQEDIHRTLRSGLLPDVVYGRNEPSLIAQHQAYERALTSGADRSVESITGGRRQAAGRTGR